MQRHNSRVHVLNPDGSPAMPTKASRARRWVRDGKAKEHWSDLGLWGVRLIAEPSGSAAQPIAIGIDPGKKFSGIGVQSAQDTLFMAHLVLPFETVKKRMEQRAMMRRTRRARRINRAVPFAQRNHRQKRFSNRIHGKLPPSIRANRQLELTTAKELAAIFPVSAIVWEYVRADVDLTSGRKKARSGKGFSPVMVGQSYMLQWLSEIAPVHKLEGWETATLRRHLGLEKSKDKAAQTPQSHAVDGVALAASQFVEYRTFNTRKTRGREWVGHVNLTPSLFKVIRRPPISRRQLHLFQFSKGGKRRKYGGTVTQHGFRKGDLVKAEMAGRQYVGWVSGDTTRQVSVSNADWRRLGQFAKSKVQLLKRNTGLLVSGVSNPTQPAILSLPSLK